MKVTQIDPVEDCEHDFAAGLQRIHRELLGYHDSVVHAHVDEDALICVIEGPELPQAPPDQRERVHAAVHELVARVLGRELHHEIEESWPLPDLHVSVLRFASA